jgi:hypothetical protein
MTYQAYVDLDFEPVKKHAIHISTKIVFGLFHLPFLMGIWS